MVDWTEDKRPGPLEKYKPHYELWTSDGGSAEARPGDQSEANKAGGQCAVGFPVARKARLRFRIPRSFFYWSVGIALIVVTLGLGTRPRRSAPTPPEPAVTGEAVPDAVPQAVVSASAPAEPTSAPAASASAPADDPADQFTFFIVLEPPPAPHYVDSKSLEAMLRDRLSRDGFPNIGVSASRDGSVFLAGTLHTESEKSAVKQIVERTPGVSTINFEDAEVKKLYGPAYLGVETAPAPNGPGVVILKVWSRSPAEIAGMRLGDVITWFAGERVTDPDGFPFMVSSRVAGERILATVEREGKEETLTVRLGELTAVASSTAS